MLKVEESKKIKRLKKASSNLTKYLINTINKKINKHNLKSPDEVKKQSNDKLVKQNQGNDLFKGEEESVKTSNQKDKIVYNQKTTSKTNTKEQKGNEKATESVQHRHKIPPRPGSKTKPIVLSADNPSIQLDASQIKFTNSDSTKQKVKPSNSKPNSKESKPKSKETKNKSKTEETKFKSKSTETNPKPKTSETISKSKTPDVKPKSKTRETKERSKNTDEKQKGTQSPGRNDKNEENKFKVPPRRPGSKSKPIVLSGDKQEVRLDPSQIRYVDADGNDMNMSEEKLNSKPVTSKESQNKQDKNKNKNTSTQEKPSGKKFRAQYQKTFTPKKIFESGRRIPPVELLAQKETDSSVKVYLFNEFLSDTECDGLMSAHDGHVKSSSGDPIICFNKIHSIKSIIKQAKQDFKITIHDFLDGTRCLKNSASSKVRQMINGNWSYSTIFYPRESKFTQAIDERIQRSMGLDPNNGDKFQITSYPVGTAYEPHTDCKLGSGEKRDRVASVLIYLNDVDEGGETDFPDLGIWVKPRKGRALLWNNMSPDGHCESHSRHMSKVVKQGKKYILMRWYYYKSFRNIGERPEPPELPVRSTDTPLILCDDLSGSTCRWYDEWGKQHLLDPS